MVKNRMVHTLAIRLLHLPAAVMRLTIRTDNPYISANKGSGQSTSKTYGDTTCYINWPDELYFKLHTESVQTGSYSWKQTVKSGEIYYTVNGKKQSFGLNDLELRAIYGYDDQEHTMDIDIYSGPTSSRGNVLVAHGDDAYSLAINNGLSWTQSQSDEPLVFGDKSNLLIKDGSTVILDSTSGSRVVSNLCILGANGGGDVCQKVNLGFNILSDNEEIRSCPDGYYTEKPDSEYFTYKSTTTNGVTCYQATGCTLKYVDIGRGNPVASYHDVDCYNGYYIEFVSNNTKAGEVEPGGQAFTSGQDLAQSELARAIVIDKNYIFDRWEPEAQAPAFKDASLDLNIHNDEDFERFLDDYDFHRKAKQRFTAIFKLPVPRVTCYFTTYSGGFSAQAGVYCEADERLSQDVKITYYGYVEYTSRKLDEWGALDKSSQYEDEISGTLTITKGNTSGAASHQLYPSYDQAMDSIDRVTQWSVTANDADIAKGGIINCDSNRGIECNDIKG